MKKLPMRRLGSWFSVLGRGLLVALCSALNLDAQAPPPVIPNECCPEVNAVQMPPGGGDDSNSLMDAGRGPTPVTTYGSASRHVAMPLIEDGMHGLARLYHGSLVFDASYTAWDGSGTDLKGGGLLVPNMDVANLAGGADAANAVQPRPGTMPGLYLLQSEGEVQAFYHYGGPLDSGANPQTTAVYQLASSSSSGGGMFTPAVLVSATTYRYTNNLSGAELWHYTGIATPYVEIKHVDGSVARFDSFDPWTTAYSQGVGANVKLWRVTQVRDPYDNAATYSYSSNHRLTQIEFSSGLKQKFNYNPGWSTWSGTDCLEITYEQGATALSDRTWGMVFSGTMGTHGGNHFGKRLHRTYSARRTVLPNPTVGQPHTITSGYAVLGQIVHSFDYNTSGRVLTESQAVHTGTPFDSSLTTPSGFDIANIVQTTYVASGTNAGRVAAQTLVQTADVMTTSYPSSGFRTTDLLSGTVMAGIEVTDASGTVRRFEFDRITGRIYSVITTPNSNFAGKPRATHASGENSGIGVGGINLATTEVEPDTITIYNIYDASCACQKPIERRIIAARGTGLPSERVTNFEYYADSKLLKKRSEPNPQAGAGPFPSQVHWEYTYVQAKTGAQQWGAWLPLREVTPDGTWDYSYGDWLDRQDATSHG